MMKIAIVGLGLIGGSLAKAVKKNTAHFVTGFDCNEAVTAFALECGAIDKVGVREDFSDADVTVLCLYPEQIIPYVKEHAALFKPGSIVTDAAGVKKNICNTLDHYSDQFTFIGGHPMAGREVSGFENAVEDLYDGASYIFTPCEEAMDKVPVLESLAKEIGFARTVLTTPEDHDTVIAYTSQIAHVLACAYVLSPNSSKHFGFSAGSFRDVSRVAKINESLWTQLFLDNKEALSGEIDILVRNLKEMQAHLDAGDADNLRAMLRRGREIKEALDQ